MQFIFAGAGPLEDKVNGVSNIKNVGFQKGEALEKLIREAKFCIVPSEWYEPFGLTIVEAQASGTPVIGADIGGIPELIADGENGRLFTSKDAEQLVAIIKELWNNPTKADNYAKACLNIQRDDLDAYCNKLIPIYRG